MSTPAAPASGVLQVAVLSPVRSTFEYLPREEGSPVPPGTRVRVPFGRSHRVGVVLGAARASALAPERLKRIAEVLDVPPLLDPATLRLLRWAAEYFHHPIGDVVVGTLPRALREGRPAGRAGAWTATAAGRAAGPATLARAPRQRAVLEHLVEAGSAVPAASLEALGGDWRRALRALVERGWVEEAEPAPAAPTRGGARAPVPSEAQARAVATVAACDGYGAFLLNGVTGSGKTEVYIELVERCVAAGRQALVLIPEIGLTPQTVARLRGRLEARVAVTHSALSDGERLDAWLAARSGAADVLIGTRSAIFVPLARPGLIVVDEEHDASLKQHEGFRYSARDLAVVRARDAGIPVVLGSATPSLESVHNAARGRYVELSLPRRAGRAEAPATQVVDLRGQRLEDGLSEALRHAVEETLERREQVLLFHNRRGFAPALLCRACGWSAECPRCDSHLVLHREDHRLRCHHCMAERPVPQACASCGAVELRPVGLGTQRIAEALGAAFPRARIERVDRDSTRRKGAVDALLARVHAGEVDILVGTQMLAKGHHFPRVTLVGILDADAGLFAADFRASERMAQLLVQVAGRAGRGERRGKVLVQTHHPHHPLLTALLRDGYAAFCDEALAERRAAGLPPHAAMTLLRADAAAREAGERFLRAASSAAPRAGKQGVRLLGPVPAPLERRAGRHRWHLLVEADERPVLQRFLDAWLPALPDLVEARRVRWSVDVDPLDLS